MAGFDFHRRRLQLRLRLAGSEPAAARALLRRWRSAAGTPAGSDPVVLRLPVVPLADLVGFDVEAAVDAEPGPGPRGEPADGCVLVVGGGARRAHELRVLERRAREDSGEGVLLWASTHGWSEELAEAARALGIGDDVLRREVESREGALACLEVAVACLIDHALLRIHPAAPGEGAPDPLAVGQRVRAWTRALPGAKAVRQEAAARGAAAEPAAEHRATGDSPDEPWRRRALELEGIEPLPAADASDEIETLRSILGFTPALPAADREEGKRETEKPKTGKASRRR